MLVLTVCLCIVAARIERSGMQFYQSVMVNDSVLLDCDVTGLPSPVITWFKDDVPLLSDDDDPPGRLRVVDDAAKLIIDSAALSDAATYQCQAENSAGQDRIHYQLTVLLSLIHI